MTDPKVVRLEEIRSKNLATEMDLKNSSSIKMRQTGDGEGGPPDMNERIGKLEGEVGGIKHSQNMLLGGIGLVAAILIALGAYTLTKLDQTGDRIDRLTEKVNDLPGKISSDLRDITKTLAESITATKQQTPQIIIMPTPPAPTPQK